MLEAIKYSNGNLLILDQLQLPHNTCYEKISTIHEAWCAIKEMKVRGAPAISIVAALSLAVHLQQAKYPSTNALYEYVSTEMKYLMTSRPTAVNLQKVCEFLIKQSKQFAEDDVTVEDAINKMIAIIENLMEDDICINKKIGELGGKHVRSFCGNTDLYMLTHCNTGSLATAGYGTALGVIRWLFQANSLNRVYCTETRPYNQGARLTAYELLHDNIPATLICDSMVAALMKTRKVSAVVVGADRVVKNGDTANKIGTYQIAVCAKHHNVPFYVACPTSSIDFSLENGDMIPIEERPSNEMTSINSIPIAAEGINCWNPAFDITPAELISGIITEHGVFSPNALHASMHKLVSANFT